MHRTRRIKTAGIQITGTQIVSGRMAARTKKLRELIFPPRCPGCDEVQESEGFCPACMSAITLNQEPVCKKCGKHIEDEQQEYCYDCRSRKHNYNQGKGVYLYEGAIKQTMYRLKYSNRRCYARVLGRAAVRWHGDWICEHDIQAIIPIPMYDGKQRQRGYNQAQVLAQEIGRLLDLPVYADIVVRKRDTVAQKGLTDVERRNNLKNAFKIRQNKVQLNRILIIDDIYTTGSTIDAVALVLRNVGVEKIYFLSICVGKGY